MSEQEGENNEEQTIPDEVAQLAYDWGTTKRSINEFQETIKTYRRQIKDYEQKLEEKMKEHNIDTIQLPDGAKVQRKEGEKKVGLSKETAYELLTESESNQLNPDSVVSTLFDQRPKEKTAAIKLYEAKGKKNKKQSEE